MGNFRNKLIRFMYGRYGFDQLCFALLVVCFILMAINSVVRSPVIGIIMWIILAWMTFRSLSKNIYKRQKENEKFLKFWNFVKIKWSVIKTKGSITYRRIKDIKTHRYRKCPHCKAVLRLPKKRGRHAVDCPRCHKEFKVRVWM
ncbi:MAG TPA: hypothetical protein GXX37_06575 [Clostridiaceae bacterium]|nr:hypothetical protein [Clostridiaceae bacterium]